MERYTELMKASGVVIEAMDAIMKAERLSPAWCKALRVNTYLQKQATHVMEGRTEDGAENEAEALGLVTGSVSLTAVRGEGSGCGLLGAGRR